MKKAKQDIITFKADGSLLEAMKGVQNRSEFIRSAVLAALENVCPLCKGSGILTPNQKNHWQTIAKDHFLDDCNDCHEVHLVCSKQPKTKLHTKRVS
jgi:hypothetical protein